MCVASSASNSFCLSALFPDRCSLQYTVLAVCLKCVKTRNVSIPSVGALSGRRAGRELILTGGGCRVEVDLSLLGCRAGVFVALFEGGALL